MTSDGTVDCLVQDGLLQVEGGLAQRAGALLGGPVADARVAEAVPAGQAVGKRHRLVADAALVLPKHFLCQGPGYLIDLRRCPVRGVVILEAAPENTVSNSSVITFKGLSAGLLHLRLCKLRS